MSCQHYYAVIFSSERTDEDPSGYAVAAEQILELARAQPGFLGVESARGEAGFGITVSYWESLEAIEHWRNQSEHFAVQAEGRRKWYRRFRIRVCKVLRENSFEADSR